MLSKAQLRAKSRPGVPLFSSTTMPAFIPFTLNWQICPFPTYSSFFCSTNPTMKKDFKLPSTSVLKGCLSSLITITPKQRKPEQRTPDSELNFLSPLQRRQDRGSNGIVLQMPASSTMTAQQRLQENRFLWRSPGRRAVALGVPWALFCWCSASPTRSLVPQREHASWQGRAQLHNHSNPRSPPYYPYFSFLTFNPVMRTFLTFLWGAVGKENILLLN